MPIAIAAVVVVCGAQIATAADDTLAARTATVCGLESPDLPATIQVPDDLRIAVVRMLKQSETFRRQCRRLADATWLRVLVRRNMNILERSYRARSLIRRARSGMVLVLVEISPAGNPVEWIAHEFEHALEQLEGVPLSDLAGRSRLVWHSSEGMFETERAIRAGRTVVAEMRLVKLPHPDKLVE